MISSRAFRAAAALGVIAALIGCGANTPPAAPSAAALLKELPASGASPAEESVAYQVNPQHTGAVKRGLRPPLKVVWSVNPNGNKAVGYPIVANGIVVVAAGSELIGIDATTGHKLWTQGAPGGYAWVGAAYDNGSIFAIPTAASGSTVDMYAFDQETGSPLWSAPAPGQSSFSSPPTASQGTVYTGGAGVGGTVYAFNESTGALNWTASVENGDDSSPVVTSKGVYVSYVCPQTYDFTPSSGKQIWHYQGSCEGGGGSTPVLYQGLLFVGDSNMLSGYDGLILTADAGTVVGGFNSSFTPAFAAKLGYFVTSHGSAPSELDARKVPSLTLDWSVTLNSDSYVSPPLVAGKIVYIVTAGGSLLGYDAKSGKQKVQITLGSGGSYRVFVVGLGYGSNELIVPNGQYLIAIQGS
ncbi:MAG: PQQ-binding-like beta-propeller repeat protein [Candidatus Eremiobacteraeota bacterium]|nr:PQQ-binding-like beta-propeller repeat protein [Candidatus Eremiobacteraeota bacterium]